MNLAQLDARIAPPPRKKNKKGCGRVAAIVVEKMFRCAKGCPLPTLKRLAVTNSISHRALLLLKRLRVARVSPVPRWQAPNRKAGTG